MTERRRNALTGEWVLVSTGRLGRPWQGASEAGAPPARPAHDPACHLCPGNVRAAGPRNPPYRGPWVFDNDFPALAATDPADAAGTAGAPGAPAGAIESPGPLLQRMPVRGRCRVLCYAERHDLDLAGMQPAELRDVMRCWRDEVQALGEAWAWVQLFENRGAAMGASSPHPHGQVWALDVIPTLVARELSAQQAHAAAHAGDALLDAYRSFEVAAGERVVLRNDHWTVLVPWWAAWPFETLLLPNRPVQRMDELDAADLDALGAIVAALQRTYDRVFATPFPYSMGWHGAARRAGPGAPADDGVRLHAHFLPPLLRSATVRKHMVGFELLAEVQRDLSPEAAAARLRECVG